MLEAGFQIDISAFTRFVQQVSAAVSTPMRDPDIRAGMERAEETYLSGMQQRYVANSGGGGDWRELTRRTREQRRRQGFQPARPILIRDATLYRGLERRKPGNLFETTESSVKGGYGGAAKHPAYSDGTGGDVSVAQVAAWHQQGTPRMPARKILHDPTADLQSKMAEPIVNGIRAMIARAIGGGPQTVANAAA